MDLNKSDTPSIWFIYAEQPYRILCNCYLLTGYGSSKPYNISEKEFCIMSYAEETVEINLVN